MRVDTYFDNQLIAAFEIDNRTGRRRCAHQIADSLGGEG